MDKACNVSAPSRGTLSWSSFSFMIVIKQNCWAGAHNFAWAPTVSLHTSLLEWYFVYLSWYPRAQLTFHEPSPRKPRLLHIRVVRMQLIQSGRPDFTSSILVSTCPLPPMSVSISGDQLWLFPLTHPKTVLLSLDAERSNTSCSTTSHLHNISQQFLEIFGIGLTPFSFSHLGFTFCFVLFWDKLLIFF